MSDISSNPPSLRIVSLMRDVECACPNCREGRGETPAVTPAQAAEEMIRIAGLLQEVPAGWSVTHVGFGVTFKRADTEDRVAFARENLYDTNPFSPPEQRGYVEGGIEDLVRVLAAEVTPESRAAEESRREAAAEENRRKGVETLRAGLLKARSVVEQQLAGSLRGPEVQSLAEEMLAELDKALADLKE